MRYFKITTYINGVLDGEIAVETYADSPDHSLLLTRGDMVKEYEPITKEEFDKLNIIEYNRGLKNMVTIESISNFGTILDGQTISEKDFNDLVRVLKNGSRFHHTIKCVKNGKSYVMWL